MNIEEKVAKAVGSVDSRVIDGKVWLSTYDLTRLTTAVVQVTTLLTYVGALPEDISQGLLRAASFYDSVVQGLLIKHAGDGVVSDSSEDLAGL